MRNRDSPVSVVSLQEHIKLKKQRRHCFADNNILSLSKLEKIDGEENFSIGVNYL
jgi:hypothetical protein